MGLHGMLQGQLYLSGITDIPACSVIRPIFYLFTVVACDDVPTAEVIRRLLRSLQVCEDACIAYRGLHLHFLSVNLRKFTKLSRYSNGLRALWTGFDSRQR
jgi:hypothetical protein